jgi:glycosyltransferase involved in cell wall biosynthesis
MNEPNLSVIVPVFRNETTLAELHGRIVGAMDSARLSYEIVFVDDGSSDASVAVIHALMSRDPAVQLIAMERNAGQQQAVLQGLREFRGELVATLDADLQDPPEALATLIAQLSASVDVVFAGRRGDYESKGRLRASRLFKHLLAQLTGLPPDAGMYLVAKAHVVRETLRTSSPWFYLPAALVATTSKVVSVPVERAPRRDGESQYSGWGRARLALAATIAALAWRLRRGFRSRVAS